MICIKNCCRRRLFGGWTKISLSLKPRSRKLVQTEASSLTKQKRLACNYGQPTPLTHPHLLGPGELVPAMKVSEFVERRERLVKAVSSLKPGMNHVIVIPSSEVLYMSEKIPYVFRQNTDFRYLTGCLEPDSTLVLSVNQSGSYNSILFVRENNPHTELWEGPRTGVTLAKEMFQMDQSNSISDLFSSLEVITKKYGNYILWYEFRNPVHRKLHSTLLPFIANSGVKLIESPKEVIHKLRLIKSKSEQKLLHSSAQIASEAISRTMETTSPGVTEHQLFATVDYYCRMKGAEYLAYPPVVATGNNANIIHYINNSQVIRDGEMVLMDAGCELHGYCSDITRTWPANGQFSDAQLTLYEIVLSVQEELLTYCSQLPSLDDLFNRMCKLLGTKLKEAHILSQQAEKVKLEEVAFKLCPHHVSHYLGMDVHDTGSVTRNIPLKEGMCITIEPGVYISNDSQLTQPEFRGCGIRIEDDILITETGVVTLSNGCPKKPSDIKKLVQKGSKLK